MPPIAVTDDGRDTAGPLLEDIVLGTSSPTHVGTVGGRSTVGDLDVVASSLVPGNHLLSTGQALGGVISAVNGDLSLGNLLGGSGAGDVASVVRHVHVGLTTAIGDPEPSAVASALGALREILGDLVGGNTLPRSAKVGISILFHCLSGIKRLLLKNGENHQVLHVHPRDVGVVRDGPGSAGSHSLVLSVHGTIVLNTVRRVARARPVLGVALSIGPLSSKLSVEGQGRLGLVVGKLNSERATSRQFNGGVARGRC